MNKQHSLYLGCFLNRIAARYNCNPLKMNPVNALHDFFDLAGPAEHLNAFENFCLSAMNDRYKWENGSPGNGLHYGELLELLVEAAYLIYKNPQKYPVASQPAGMVKDLPLLLTRAQYDHPFSFLDFFFTEASLPHRKKQVAVFTAAAISNSSVMDELTGIEIFKFLITMPRLVYAAHRFLATG